LNLNLPNEVNLNGTLRTIRELNVVREKGSNETVTRQTLVTGLADMFPMETRPWWVLRHIRGAEAVAKFIEEGRNRSGYADSLVGATAIEYESDLRKQTKFKVGKHQVAQYCAGLLNEGIAPELVVGVLSDGIDWYAYKVGELPTRQPGSYEAEDVELLELESLSLKSDSQESALQWIDFLRRYFGRDAARPLTAESLTEYLGFESAMGHAHFSSCMEIIAKLRISDPTQSLLIRNIWGTYAAYLSIDAKTDEEDNDLYAREFYLSLIGRLICANVIVQRPLISSDNELVEILNGGFFEVRGINRLVEHDYFGWLVSERNVEALISTVRTIQMDLRAYDYTRQSEADIFGHLMASLAEASQRLLLGQEWTPSWLSDQMAARMVHNLDEEWPQFVDMCSGSGAMIIAVAKQVQAKLRAGKYKPGSTETLKILSNATTGFDIDPLAVILSKVNWIVANRDWLGPLDGSLDISVPVYNADSLYALAPIFGSGNASSEYESHMIKLLDREISLPDFLVTPEFRGIFDKVVEHAYQTGMSFAEKKSPVATSIDSKTFRASLKRELVSNAPDLEISQVDSILEFAQGFATNILELELSGKNGIWAFVLRNSYRPGLLSAQFNGLISNPPWLAMSRLRHNPFGPILEEKAKQFDLVPAGSAFLHLEMSTVFLAHAVNYYLKEGAYISCVLPDTVRQGRQHQSFRDQLSGMMDSPPIKMTPSELWRVPTGTFKNQAIIILGRKTKAPKLKSLSGMHTSEHESKSIINYPAKFGTRRIWSEKQPDTVIPNGYMEGFSSQGADIMPRRLFAFSIFKKEGDQLGIRTPSRGDNDWYLLADDKKHKDFVLSDRFIPIDFTQKCYLSKHLSPFILNEPATVVLPIKKTSKSWRLATSLEINSNPRVKAHFDSILKESDFESLEDMWVSGLNFRVKLSNQIFIDCPEGFVVLYGAGGEIPTAAYVSISELVESKGVIDQTLYWCKVESEDEALYLTGMINSKAMRDRISDFIPEGAFGGRHLHTMPSKAIPVFDPSDDNHVRVSNLTSKIIEEVKNMSLANQTSHLFSSSLTLASRRTKIRGMIERLLIYVDFENACASIYED
jgi:methylase of polypeptide subunit release factors